MWLDCPRRVSQKILGGSPITRKPSTILCLTHFDGRCHPFSSTAIRYSSSRSSTESAFRDRLQELRNVCLNPYPRLPTQKGSLSCAEFRSRYEHLIPNQVIQEDIITLHGRIRSHRLAGGKLVFLDILQNGHKVQVMCNKRLLDGVPMDQFRKWSRVLRRGDTMLVTGRPHRMSRGELTLEATELPGLLSPCLHDVPIDAKQHEHSPYARHIQFLASQDAGDIIRNRSAIVQYLRQFLLDRFFLEVNTPILAACAGGAIARPFYTSASEFPEKQLSLRIAPELWLKRLVVGGFDRVFEIGPSFRNEGLDKTHNPEFTTCEFYQTYASLEDLVSMTEDLLSGLAAHIHKLKEDGKSTLAPTEVNFSAPFHRIDFITGIEEATGRSLPNLTAEDAVPKTLQLFEDLSLHPPELPNLPRLMDKLCSIYLEPQCQRPTFIINPPECISPLSKSFTHPTRGQQVAARCELFIQGREFVNAYEEENSPFEQRRKFQEQLLYSKAINEEGEIDESYIQALEWGLPPTGGWGCGIDRLCMLFTGTQRIGDVLPFGNLRAVVRRHDGMDIMGLERQSTLQ